MKKILLAFGLLFSTQLFAQSPQTKSEKTVHNRQNWFVYAGQYKLSQHWGIHTDVQFRMDEEVKQARQNILRAGLIRYLNTDLNAAVGYAYINSFSTLVTRGGSLNYYAPEHRIWEQLNFNHRPANLNMTHRFRVEQRFLEKLSNGPDDRIITENFYANRVRYLNRIIIDLTKNPENQYAFYVSLQDEVFANIASPEVNSNFFDQNRFQVALGVFHDKKTRLELGYLNQFLNPQTGPNIMNHILQVSVAQTLDFSSPAN